MPRTCHGSHRKSCAPESTGALTAQKEGGDGGRKTTAGLPISLSLLSTLQPKQRARADTLTLLANPSPEVQDTDWTWRRQSGNCCQTKSTNWGSLDWFLSSLCANCVSKFPCLGVGVTILTVYGSLKGCQMRQSTTMSSRQKWLNNYDLFPFFSSLMRPCLTRSLLF